MFFRLLACLALVLLFVPAARADTVSDLKAQLQQMQQQMDALKKQLDQVQQQQQQQQQQIQANKAQQPQPAAAPPTGALSIVPQEKGVVTDGKTEHRFLERKPGDTFTLYTPGGEAQIYGNLDVSFDVTTKGIENFQNPDGSKPVGRNGWMPAISTNLSYIGIRGFQDLGDVLPFNFVYQLETQIDIAATSGTSESNSNQSNVVKGGLTSRNSFIGLSSNDWGL